jgi:ABC-2 type transport system ATP-binding protein
MTTGTDITIDRITVAYGRRQVLHGVEWTIRPGVTGLLGPNGSGKTTLLSTIVRLLRPREGTIAIGSGDARPRFGFVPQRFSMAGGMRLVDAVTYTAWINGVTAAERDDAAQRALDTVDLAGERDQKVKTLSGGQRQRAGIAAALAHDPDVLVLDEPTVGLDPTQRWRLRDLITELGTTRTVVVSTHLLDDVKTMCQRVGVLAAGRLVFDGTVTELETLHDGPDTDGRRSPIERGYEQLLATAGADE